VLWMRVSRIDSDPQQTLGYFRFGSGLVMLNRGDYWQCGLLIPKGALEQLKAEGLERFRQKILRIVPFLDERVAELKSWDDIKLLSVQVNRLKQWYLPGLLCIGDAAHAMSPAGGVGINLAIQDAIAAANILAAPLRAGKLSDEDLRRVQKRREFPTRMTQGLQIRVQDAIFKGVIGGQQDGQAPFAIRLFAKFRFLSRVSARLIGMGFRPEHIQTPEVLSR